MFIGGACRPDTIYSLVDPTMFTELEFEQHVRAALECVYRDYHCIPFRGVFQFDGDTNVADLALIHKQFKHWFVIEVELVSHSLYGHVIPQVRSFQYGTPADSCAEQIGDGVPQCDIKQARTLLKFVPKSVAVVANRADKNWIEVLRGHNVQFVAVSIFKTTYGGYALETEGSLDEPSVSLGFFTYSATNRAIRVSLSCGLPIGELQIEDPYGTVGSWTVRAAPDALWITKNAGDPGFEDNTLLQIIRKRTGKLTLRIPR